MDTLQYLELPLMQFGITAILAMSLQLILGGAGLLSLGHAAFFAVGGYFSGALSVHLTEVMGITSPFLLLPIAVVVGALGGAFTGFLVAIPCLRLQGDYLAMASLGFGEILSNLLKNIDFLGGATGLRNIPKLSSIGTIWITVLLVALLLKGLYRSGLGYGIQATRDDEIAARSVGISTYRSKLAAFVIGSGLAGVAGVFYAHMQQVIVPDEAGFLKSVEVVLAVVIGGMTSLFGSFLGALIMIAVPNLLRFAPPIIAQNSMLFFSIVVIILMVSRPQGLASFFERLGNRGGKAGGGA